MTLGNLLAPFLWPQPEVMTLSDVMRAPRLFVDHALSADANAPLNDEQTNYLRNVLRLKAGDAVRAFNGLDGEWRCRFLEIGKKKAALQAEVLIRAQTRIAQLDYFFAPLKHARLDYMVQKAVEMGASRLCPVITRHTQVSRVNASRMRANAIEAAEQCGILNLPEVAQEIVFDEWIKKLPVQKVLIFCDEEAPAVSPAHAFEARSMPPDANVGVLIGPEGGFDDRERRTLLERKNVLRLRLGPRILRADTAAVAALALAQTFLGDWR